MSLGRAPRAPRDDRLDQRARARAGRRGRRARHARHGRRADRGARAPGPHVGHAAGRRRSPRRWSCASSTSCCRCAPGSPSPTSPGRTRCVKWPNDVWIDGRKVAGILAEARPRGWAVLGIGVNVAVDVATLPEEAAAVAGTLGRRPTTSSRRSRSCSPRWRQRLGEDRAAALAALRERDALLGRRVRWQDGEGIGAGIDDDRRAAASTLAERRHDRAHRGRGHAQRAALINARASAGGGGSAAACCRGGARELVPLGLAARAEVGADLVVVAAVRAARRARAPRSCSSWPGAVRGLAQMLNMTASSSSGSSASSSALVEGERQRLVEALRRPPPRGGARSPRSSRRASAARPARAATISAARPPASGGTSWSRRERAGGDPAHASNRCVEPGRRADAYHAQ